MEQTRGSIYMRYVDALHRHGGSDRRPVQKLRAHLVSVHGDDCRDETNLAGVLDVLDQAFNERSGGSNLSGGSGPSGSPAPQLPDTPSAGPGAASTLEILK